MNEQKPTNRNDSPETREFEHETILQIIIDVTSAHVCTWFRTNAIIVHHQTHLKPTLLKLDSYHREEYPVSLSVGNGTKRNFISILLIHWVATNTIVVQ